MATAPLTALLTPKFDDFLTKGYFHDRVIPPLKSSSLQNASQDIANHIQPIIQSAIAQRFRLRTRRSQPVHHSVPKRKHLRRMLSIPNPLPHAILSNQIVAGWPEIQAVFLPSPISLSFPISSNNRAVESLFSRNDETSLRARRSVGCRYLLTADIVRFYPSIYTHSIPWALHTKTVARNDPDNLLLGNRLDVCVRESQDKQTGGIPIGPDTSFVLGEIISSAMDWQLEQALGNIPLRGTRFIDDYNLYFETRGDAERGIAAIHGVARSFELEINDTKTEISELPEALEPSWKTHLRGMQIDESASSVQALFDHAAEFVPRYPFDSIYTYVAKKLLDQSLSYAIWSICEPLLMRAAIAEPGLLPVLIELLDLHGLFDQDGLVRTLEYLCRYHAPLQQGYEVAWALWLCCRFQLSISQETADVVALVDDDIVALVALDLRNRGLMPNMAFPLWESRMSPDSLYSEHWLLAFEALRKGWLPSLNGNNYIAADPFFSILESNNVEFYDPLGGVVPSIFVY
jgi:hypothetical protein